MLELANIMTLMREAHNVFVKMINAALTHLRGLKAARKPNRDVAVERKPDKDVTERKPDKDVTARETDKGKAAARKLDRYADAVCKPDKVEKDTKKQRDNSSESFLGSLEVWKSDLLNTVRGEVQSMLLKILPVHQEGRLSNQYLSPSRDPFHSPQQRPLPPAPVPTVMPTYPVPANHRAPAPQMLQHPMMGPHPPLNVMPNMSMAPGPHYHHFNQTTANYDPFSRMDFRF